MKTLRFWDYINGDWVKLSLKPNQVLSHYSGGATDEGWHSESVTWEHTGAGIRAELISDGVDCDGRLTSCQSVYCAGPFLSVRDCGLSDAPGLLPDWQKLESSQRDYSAEAMNY